MFAELFDAEERDKKDAKKRELAEKVKLARRDAARATKGTSKSSTENTRNPSAVFVDGTRPEKRVLDRLSGTGRGKEVSKDGHGGWGKAIEKDEKHWDKIDVEKDIAAAKEAEKKELAKLREIKKQNQEANATEEKKDEKEGEKKGDEEKKEAEPAPEPEPEPMTLEEYEQSIASKRVIVTIPQKKAKKDKKVESEVELKNTKVMNAGRVRSVPSATLSAAPKKEEKKKDGELTTEDFFAGVQFPRPHRGGGRGRGRFEGRGEGRGEDRGEGRGRGRFEGRREEGGRFEGRGAPRGEGRGEGRGAPRGEGRGEGRGFAPRPPRGEGLVQGEPVHDRYVPGQQSSSAKPAAASPSASSPSSSPPYARQQRPPREFREHRRFNQSAPVQKFTMGEESFPTLGGN